MPFASLLGPHCALHTSQHRFHTSPRLILEKRRFLFVVSRLWENLCHRQFYPNDFMSNQITFYPSTAQRKAFHWFVASGERLLLSKLLTIVNMSCTFCVSRAQLFHMRRVHAREILMRINWSSLSTVYFSSASAFPSQMCSRYDQIQHTELFSMESCSQQNSHSMSRDWSYGKQRERKKKSLHTWSWQRQLCHRCKEWLMFLINWLTIE